MFGAPSAPPFPVRCLQRDARLNTQTIVIILFINISSSVSICNFFLSSYALLFFFLFSVLASAFSPIFYFFMVLSFFFSFQLIPSLIIYFSLCVF